MICPLEKEKLHEKIDKISSENGDELIGLLRVCSAFEEYLDYGLKNKVVMPFETEAQTYQQSLLSVYNSLNSIRNNPLQVIYKKPELKGLFIPSKEDPLIYQININELPKTVYEIGIKLEKIKKQNEGYEQLIKEIYDSIEFEVLLNKELDNQAVLLAQGKIIIKEGKGAGYSVYSVEIHPKTYQDFQVVFDRVENRTFKSLQEILTNKELIPKDNINTIVVRNNKNYDFQRSFLPVLENKYEDILKSEQINNFS